MVEHNTRLQKLTAIDCHVLQLLLFSMNHMDTYKPHTDPEKVDCMKLTYYMWFDYAYYWQPCDTYSTVNFT